jgi:hypothetical protein
VIRSTQLPPQTPLPTVAPAGGKASTPSRASGRSANEHPIAGGQPTTPTTPVHTATGRRGAPTRSTVVDVAVAVGGLLAAALLLMAANVVARRTRWRRRRSRPGTGPATPGAVATLAAWDEVLETLGWQGLARREGETFGEFARRAGRDPLLRRGGLPPAGPTVGDVARLAELSSLAAYGRDVPDDLVEEALATAGALRAEANRRLTRRRRLRLLIDPRLAFTARPARS